MNSTDKFLHYFLAEAKDRASNHGVFGIDPFYRIIYWNAVMVSITGIMEHKCIGRSVFEVFPFLSELGEESTFRNVLLGKKILNKKRPYLTLHSGGKGYVNADFLPVKTEEQRILGGLVVLKNLKDSIALKPKTVN